MLPFISIIIPCYNVAEYLPKGIESLRLQNTDLNAEFIFINDGSTDNTLEIIKKFEKEDSRVKVINKVNAGVSAARNDALDISSGQYVLFLDGDDYLTDDALDILYKNLCNDKIDLLIPGVIINVNNHIKERAYKIKEGIYSINDFWKKINDFPTTPKLVYRNSIIKNHIVRFNDKLKAGEVYDFTCSFLRYCHHIAYYRLFFYIYVIRESSATNSNKNHSSDLNILNTLTSIYTKSDVRNRYPSFNLTAYKLVLAFTYYKYFKNKDFSKDALYNLKNVSINPAFRCCVNFLFNSQHINIKDKIMAKAIITLPIISFFVLYMGYRLKQCFSKKY